MHLNWKMKADIAGTVFIRKERGSFSQESNIVFPQKIIAYLPSKLYVNFSSPPFLSFPLPSFFLPFLFFTFSSYYHIIKQKAHCTAKLKWNWHCKRWKFFKNCIKRDRSIYSYSFIVYSFTVCLCCANNTPLIIAKLLQSHKSYESQKPHFSCICQSKRQTIILT